MKIIKRTKLKKKACFKLLSLIFIAVLSITFFAFGGYTKVQSAFVNLQKYFDGDEKISGKTREPNGDGTYKLSLSVEGDADSVPHIEGNANVLIIYDVSGSMQDPAYKYTKVTDTNSNNRYGLVNGRYVLLTRHGYGTYGSPYYYTDSYGDRYDGDRYSRSVDANDRYMKAEKTLYDFVTALQEYNNITPGTISMAMASFSAANHGGAGAGNESNATWLIHGTTNQNAWTTDLNNISRHLSSDGTTRPSTNYRIQYGGGTNWEAALQRAKSMVNAIPEERKGYDTFVIFVTDGAPTYRVTSVDGSTGSGSSFHIENYRQALDEAKAIVDLNDHTDLFGIYAFGNEQNTLDDLIHYAYTGTDRTLTAAQKVYEGTVPTDNYYSATESSQFEAAVTDIFSNIATNLGIGDVEISDGTTTNVETSTGVAHLLKVVDNSYTYAMKFPVRAVSGQSNTYTITRKNSLGQDYTITLTQNSNGTYQATWGDKSVELKGTVSLGTFEYVWEEANDFYDVAPPAASYNDETSAVEWNLDRETVGTLLDGVTYTVYFDVYPSQETYDIVADINNASDKQAAYNALDPAIKEYLKYEDGAFTLETNTEATLSYVDNRNGNTERTYATYENPPRVVTESSELNVHKVWLNDLDLKQAPTDLTLTMDVLRDGTNVDTVTVKNDNQWKDSVAISTGLLRTYEVVENGETVTKVEVLDSGYDYTLTEPVINLPNFKTYQWELQMETVHPMLVNGTLTTLVVVPNENIPIGMGNAEYYTEGGHHFYRFNNKVYYDKTIDAELNAYNIRKSNFNFTKAVEGDAPDEYFNFVFKVDNTINEEVWFSVCDPKKLAALGKTCEDSDAYPYYEKDLETNAHPEYEMNNDEIVYDEDGNPVTTGYYYADDNSNIELAIKEGWNVRVTNIGTGSTYTITETDLRSPFELVDINGDVVISVPELPANAIQVDDTTYTVTTLDGNGNQVVTTYTKVTETINNQQVVHYEYTYRPNVNKPNKTMNGQIIQPNNTYSVTFTNKYPKTYVEVDKEFIGPEESRTPVVMNLYKIGSDEVLASQTLDNTYGWTHTFKDLDVFDEETGEVIQYYVKETPVEDYETHYSGTENIEVYATDIPEGTTEISVAVNIIGSDSTTTKTVTLNAENGFRQVLEAEEYLEDDGTAKKVELGTNPTQANIHLVLTDRKNHVTNEEKTRVEGSKTWVDDNNRDDSRPESITINLYADGGEEPIDSMTVTAADDWSWSFTDLPKYRVETETDEETGEVTTTYVEIEYTISEEAVEGYGNPEVDGYNVTNTHELETVDVEGSKTWVDDENRDDSRPESITIHLWADYQEEEIDSKTVTAADGWSWSWTDLPKYLTGEVGHEITYTITEDAVEGYGNPDVQGYNVTNTHELETVDVEGSKTWVDDENRDNSRPTSITIHLFADDTEISSQTVTEADGWSWSWTDLPKYLTGEVGHEITYTITEDTVDGYGEPDVQGYSVTNTHELETVDVEGSKTWVDDENRDDSRPESITIYLWADYSEEPIDSKTVTAADGWSWSWTDLPKYLTGEVGHEITYTITEDAVEGYGTPDVQGYNVTNTHELETVDVEGSKTWVDDENRDNSRPNSITIYLYADYQEEPIDSQTVTAADGWSWSWTDLPKYLTGEVGHEITYTITEEAVDGYGTPDVQGYNVTNTHELETVDVEGSKTWVDDENRDNSRPESITIHLWADYQEEEIDSKTVTAADGWSWSWTDLPKYLTGEVGHEIVYTITEDPVDGYGTPDVNGYNVMNTHEMETVDVEGSKTWVDDENRDDSRPTSITIHLLADGEVIKTKTVTADDGWSWSWTDLPKYLTGEVGHEIVYTITEEAVDNYGTPDVQGYDVTNTHELETVDVEGSKTWVDDENRDDSRPESITIYLWADYSEEPIDSKTVTADDNWSWSWTDLPKYLTGEVGHEIVYTITEEAVDGYGTPDVQGYNVTNTHELETVDVEGSKTWVDDENRDNSRPESITIYLYADYSEEPIDSKTVTAENGWSWSWTDLPKYLTGEVGHEITYTITEEAVDGYGTPDVQGYNVTNTHELETVDVEGLKTWVDDENRDNSRPNSITIYLYADYQEEPIDSMTVTAADGWSWSFPDLPKYLTGEVGHEITYTIDEEPVDGYGTPDVQGYNVTNTHELETVDVEGSKTWVDDENRDNSRPGSITIYLYADYQEEPIDSKTVTADDGWSWSWTDLPKYLTGEVGHEITYTIDEDPVEGYGTPDVQGYNVTNTHELETVDVEGSKTWVDDENRDNSRPESITIHLFADYQEEEIDSQTVTEADGWSWSFQDLPKYLTGEVGHEIVYTITEDPVDGYGTPLVSGYNVTNTHTLDTVDVEGSKTWVDDENRDNSRPTSITIHLYADYQEEIASQTVTADNGWSWSWKGLPKYLSGEIGHEIVYTITEDPVDGYGDQDVQGYNVTNTHELETVDVEGSKTWVDDENRDNSRPESITIHLFADYQEEEIDSQTVTEADGWSWSFQDLPKYLTGEVGHEIVYTITEDPVDGYGNPDVQGYNVTNTHELETVDVEGSKTWSDDENRDNARPTSITINLLADGTVIDTKTVTAADGWSWSWPELPKYLTGDVGHEIVYTITEGSIDGYTPNVQGYNVTNTHEPETVDVEGVKTWDDSEDQDGIRPDSIMIYLYADYSDEAIDSKEATKEEGFVWSFTGLPKYLHGEVGHEIVYTVEEGEVTNYQASETPNEDYGITNTHNPFKTSIKVVKEWEDAGDQDGLRPDSVTFILMADDVKQIGTFELNEGNNWTYENNELPRRAGGKDIVYSVTEIGVNYDDYTPTDETVNELTSEQHDDQTTVITVTNTHIPETTDVEGHKIWTDDNDRDGLRPETIEISLVADDVVQETIPVTADNNWSWSWKGLPKYRDQGTEIVYKVTEKAISGYEAQPNGYDIENIHVTAKTSLSGEKVWRDENDQDGLRPDSVNINLIADDVIIDTQNANPANGWSYSWTDLPMYRDQGETIVYRVAEDVVTDGYEETHEGNNVVNTHIPETIDIPIEKIWEDNLDQDGKRPTSITLYVMDGEETVRTVPVEGDLDSESWSYTIEGLPKYKDHGTPIEYTIVEETVSGYNSVVTPTSDKVIITNTHNTQKVDIPVSKIWVDNGQTQYRPKYIEINLFADGVKVTEEPVKVYPNEEDGSWSYLFTGMEYYRVNAHGDENETIVYTVEELPVENYTTAIRDNLTIVNTISNDLTKDIPVTKIWNDEGDQDGLRPDSINVYIIGTIIDDDNKQQVVYAPEEPITITPDEEGNWKGVFEKVPIFHEGTMITYNVEEDAISKYEMTGVDIAEDQITITNTHVPEIISISATKKWEDAENQDGKRPESVTFALMVGEETLETLVATEETGWSVTFTDKPKCSGGQAIPYVVEEVNVDSNYEVSDVSQVEMNFTITNEHVPLTITYTVNKSWDDFDNNDGERPDHITVRLYANGVEVASQDIYEDPETHEWTYTFENLPKYKDQQLIVYTITEDHVDLYETQEIKLVPNDESTEAIVNTITNQHSKIPYNGTGIITVNKYWDDEDDKYKKRPNSITVKLLADEEIVASAELSKANDWSYTFTKLPHYRINEDGEVRIPIVYRIEEVEVEDYITTINGFDITNKYNGEVPEIIPPRTGVVMKTKSNKNVLFEMIVTLLSVSYTIVVAKKVNE